MTLDQLFKLLGRARELTSHKEFVIVGSNAALALAEHAPIPEAMAMSMDLDCYTKADPGRIFELAATLGEDSPFHRQEGFFLDPVSPKLPTLPDGWEGRLISIERDGCKAWFLDPNDAAVSKYARGEPRDRSWIRAGIESGIVSLPRVKSLTKVTPFLDDAEHRAALARIEEDAALSRRTQP